MEYYINIYPRADYQDKKDADDMCALYHRLGFEEAEVIEKGKVLKLVKNEKDNANDLERNNL